MALGAGGHALHAQGQPDYEQPPVSYSATTPRDAMARIQARVASGELAFAGSEQQILQALLAELQVSPESQVLVFSKTSLQRGRIQPEHPRALYFSESAYVGWVPGGLFEITTIDPQLGPVFYSFRASRRGDKPPEIERDSDCLRCHGGTFVRDIPGVFVRSVFPDRSGEPLLRHGTLVVDDETPFEQRWGGWYVTGYEGALPHRGNVLGSEVGDQLVFEPTPERPADLAKYFDVAPYLRPRSDVVALLVLEHQLTMQNSLTRAGMMCRKMIAYQHGLQKAFKEPITDEPAYDSVKSVFGSAVQDVVDRLLFRNAAPLPAGVVGHDAYRAEFGRGAPRSRGGLALKDLQLREQIFAHRCSFLIYSDTFRELPAVLKERILERLQEALQSRDPKNRYAYLPSEEKERIFRILVETHPDAKREWGTEKPAPGGG